MVWNTTASASIGCETRRGLIIACALMSIGGTLVVVGVWIGRWMTLKDLIILN